MNAITAAKRLALVLGAALLVASCASERLAKRLDPVSREFYSKVRYIITAEERKAFLALPEADRPAFIEDFWKRRDPKPQTEENEFKTEYFNRINTANRLFSGGAAPGWLQDRGRVYITLGPPDYRETYPRGITFYGLPTEIWWYGFFAITFIDEKWVDDYRLDPDGAVQIAMINRAEKEWNVPRVGYSKGDFGPARTMAGLDVRIEKAEGGGARFTLVLPYPSIWMKASGDKFETTLEVTMTVRDAQGAEAWTFAKSFSLEVPVSRLKETAKSAFNADAAAALGPGSYTLAVTVTNTHDGSKASLERAFTI
ncbi:MAG TPA: GWxTD domain-containing protein [Acidobacteriota bacterium]|nr:GWxTD domain-containing protein [Acidobacteriota bacterium]